LVLRARRKDAAAFEALIRRYERVALSVAFGVLGDATGASDVVQDGFIRAWQRLADLKEPDRFGSWLCGIVRNLALDARRRNKREVRQFSTTGGGGENDSDEPTPLLRLVGSEDDEPSAELNRREEHRQVAVALESLDEISREAVVLRYYEGMSSKEIGALLDLAPAAVDMRLMRARRHLCEQLREQFSERLESHESPEPSAPKR
jgi:RNA polymerase sigma-70 factor (ECF subfamily)